MHIHTVNKIQGQSLQHALVDLRSTWGTQALYVMISRTVSLENLAMMHWFPSNNLDWRLLLAYRKEFDMLKMLDEQTTAKFKQRCWKQPDHLKNPKTHLQPCDIIWDMRNDHYIHMHLTSCQRIEFGRSLSHEPYIIWIIGHMSCTWFFDKESNPVRLVLINIVAVAAISFQRFWRFTRCV